MAVSDDVDAKVLGIRANMERARRCNGEGDFLGAQGAYMTARMMAVSDLVEADGHIREETEDEKALRLCNERKLAEMARRLRG